VKAKHRALGGCAIVAAVSAGWIHGIAVLCANSEVADQVPCTKFESFEKDGRIVKVIGPPDRRRQKLGASSHHGQKVDEDH
jgi:hypothetical protein